MLHIRHEEFNLSRLFDEIFEGRSKYVDETLKKFMVFGYIFVYTYRNNAIFNPTETLSAFNIFHSFNQLSM